MWSCTSLLDNSWRGKDIRYEKTNELNKQGTRTLFELIGSMMKKENL